MTFENYDGMNFALYANTGDFLSLFPLNDVQAIYMDCIRDRVFVLVRHEGEKPKTYVFTGDITIKIVNLGFVPCDKFPQ